MKRKLMDCYKIEVDMKEVGILMLVVILRTLCSSMAYAYEGIATFYAPPYVPSACNGNETPETRMIAVAIDSIWNNGEACGRSYIVKCIGSTNQMTQPCKEGEVMVKIVDNCPSGSCAAINLSQEAFAMIADTNAGSIRIQYQDRS